MSSGHSGSYLTRFLTSPSRMQPQTKKALADFAIFAISQIAVFYGFRYVMTQLDPRRQGREEAKRNSRKALKRLGVKDMELDEHEMMLAGEVVHPDDITVGFSDIGGLDPIISDLRESVIYPLCYPALFKSTAGLFGAPKGVLLYGPPGCGKTMLAKALAKESGATFINIKPSDLSSKWFGESSKLVAALFSLARKLQPSIVFIDEIDSFMRERSRTDHEVTGMMKAEFMTLWDGLSTTHETRIMVLGATNRPNDIDQAILRRMPKRFAVRLPDASQRRNILNLMLHDITLEPRFSLDALVRRTEGLSGSDLKEMCRAAAMAPVREYMREKGGDHAAMEEGNQDGFAVRPVRLTDFEMLGGQRRTQAETEVDNLD